MQRIVSLLFLITVATSCDDALKAHDPKAPDEQSRQRSSFYWFPEIQNPPAFIPSLPSDFIPGFITNKNIRDGILCLVWSSKDNIDRLNRGETSTTAIFLVVESSTNTEFNTITPSSREEFILNYTAFGYSDLKCDSFTVNDWTIEWFSGAKASDFDYVAWLSKTGANRKIEISLITDEANSPLWESFINSIKNP